MVKTENKIYVYELNGEKMILDVELTAKPIKDDEFWILKDGERKVGNVFANNVGTFNVTLQDEVFEFETVTVTDSIVPHLTRYVTDSVTFSDTANINGEKVVINSQTITDDGGISKQFQQPANADSVSLSDSVGFELGTLSSVFNTGKVNDMLFNAVGYDQEFLTDSITASDAVSLAPNSGQSETVSVSDSVGFDFLVGSVFNTSAINLSQFNS